MRRLDDQHGITLIELLIAMTIASIISAMLLTSWFALNTSYTYSVNSNKARDLGRQAMSRIQREVRDAEFGAVNVGPPPNQFTLNEEPAILRSRPWTLTLTTTFNESGNTDPGKKPHLVAYRLYYMAADDKAELWRFEDTYNATTHAMTPDGRISGLTFYSADEPTSNGRPNFNNNERSAVAAAGDRAELVVRDVVNTDTSLATPVALFTYSGYFDDSGALTFQTDVRGKDNRLNLLAVRIHLLIDLNPKRSPVFADLINTAQLRNQRQF